MGLRADVSQPSPPLHIHTCDLSCPALCDPGDQSPFPLRVSRTDITPAKSPQPVFPPAFSITANWTLRTGGRIFFNQLDSRPLTGEFQSATLCQAQKGQPVLFSYEQAQYGVWTYNLTSLWMECDFFFYIVVCSRGLIENSPCILLYCSRKLNSTLPTKA